jgi:acyl-CoA thioester hydrolase
MAALFRTSRRVEFRDTDAAGIMHFSAFFLFMEEAEHEFLRQRGLSVLMQDADGPVSWPRVAVSCDYRSPAKFEDVLDIEVRVERLGTKSITYNFSFSTDGRPVAEGQMTAVCCRLFPDGPPQSIPIPAWVAQKLR